MAKSAKTRRGKDYGALVLFALIFLQFSYAIDAGASNTDFWITQDGAGAQDGSSLANAASCGGANQLTCAAFNNSANWGSGSNQIGPRTTVHLSGTFVAAAGAACYLAFQAGGSSGQVITLHFETDALLTAPYWSNGSGWMGGAICTGPGFITIDGGTNGAIQATANGTQLANQVDGGSGVFSPGENNLTIQNLTVSNIYVHTCMPTSTQPPVTGCPDEGGQSTGGIALPYGGNNITVSNNTVHDAKWCISVGWSGGQVSSNYLISNNTACNCDHTLAVGDGNDNATLNGVVIYGNVFHDGANWDDNGDANHHDGIHIWAVHTGSQLTGERIYNNYIYGNWGIDFNSFIFDDDGPGTDTAPEIFNNILNDQGTLGHYGSGYIALGSVNPSVYNNTVIGPGTAVNAQTTGWRVENNIFEGGTIYFNGAPGPHFAVWDYNDYYGCTNDGNCFNNTTSDLTTWQSVCGCDLHSLTANAELNSNYEPSAGSPIIGVAVNLEMTCNGQPNPGLGALCYDKAGYTRPSSAPWDIGAYQYCAPGTCATTPPPPININPVLSPRAYPNPWRADRGYAQQVTFDQLAGNTTIKIFTISGHLVRTLATSNSLTAWDLNNDSGDKVASGVYIFLATNDHGQTARGKVVVIR